MGCLGAFKALEKLPRPEAGLLQSPRAQRVEGEGRVEGGQTPSMCLVPLGSLA